MVTPSTHPCKDEGAAAAEAGVHLADNPHLPGTADHNKWMEGWCNRSAMRPPLPN